MKTIIQKITFKNTTLNELYSLYMNPKLHSEITGSGVIISEKAGSKLFVFDGYITGKTLYCIKNSLIVQEWIGSDWDEDTEASVLVLSFEQKGKNVIVNLCHANVPDIHAESIDKGWYEYYWESWGKYLTKKG